MLNLCIIWNLFQCYFERLLDGISNIAVYVDDIIVFTEEIPQHLRILDEIFSRFREKGVRINKEKSAFLNRSVKFLGRVFDDNGMSLSSEYAIKIQDWPVPNTGSNYANSCV